MSQAILGVDFTSTPTRRKPITVVSGRLIEKVYHADNHEPLDSLGAFEAFLSRRGPWIAGCDFPFGQSRQFLENIGWPVNWAAYVDHVAPMARKQFRAELDAYRANREPGDKEHRRQTDILAGAISPQKLYGVPVGLMFHEGATRLRGAGVTVPGLQKGDPDRIAIEAYPGVLARHLIGKLSYKDDAQARQTSAHHQARKQIVAALTEGALLSTHGVRVKASSELLADIVADPMADRLDALLCAVQAAWAWTQRHASFGAPDGVDAVEGWIAEPTLYQ